MPIFFGGKELSDEAATSHFMIVGTTGSGKTLTLRMMMNSVLPSILDRPDQRAVIFDVKQDMLSILYGMGFKNEHLCILNPFDKRCYEWNLAADITGPDTALQLATILIPEENSQNRYFSDAARDLLCGIINVFIDKGRERQEKTGDKPAWTLADLVYTMRSLERIEHVLSQTEEGRDLAALHLKMADTSLSVLSTARSRLAPFEVIAALWRLAGKQGRRISLKGFLKGNGILVLGNNQTALAPIQAINRVIFRRLTELVLAQSENKARRTWFFLDEARKLGKLDGLDDLMTNGRSKGAAVVLGFQDIDGMRAVYGKEIAGEITSMCGNFGVLRVSGASTPEWASEIFGEEEKIDRHKNEGTSSGYSQQAGSSSYSSNHSSGYSEQIRLRRVFLSSEFRALPLPEKGAPLPGFFHTPYLRERGGWLNIRQERSNGAVSYKIEIPPDELSHRLGREDNSDLNFEEWEKESFKKLVPWEEDDFKRLGIASFLSADEGGNQDPPQGLLLDPFAKPGMPGWLPKKTK